MFNFSEHYVSKHLLCAIAYGDDSGLDDAESAQLDAWMAEQGAEHYEFPDGDDTDFRRCEVSGLMADCATIMGVHRVD